LNQEKEHGENNFEKQGRFSKRRQKIKKKMFAIKEVTADD
jgi:hypothetical protein